MICVKQIEVNTQTYCSYFCLTVVNDAIFKQGLSQVYPLFRFADLSALYQPWHELTEDTEQQRHKYFTQSIKGLKINIFCLLFFPQPWDFICLQLICFRNKYTELWNNVNQAEHLLHIELWCNYIGLSLIGGIINEVSRFWWILIG